MWLRRAVILGMLGVGVATFSCSTFDFPSETCDPSTLDAKLDPPYSDGQCSRCLEDHCCDIVGRCEHADGCPAAVHSAHKCVLDDGVLAAAEEANCVKIANIAAIPEANDAYRCMRSSCGNECSLPVCQLDQAATLIRNAKCDACFSGACCAPLNSCYGDRACKLMLECMVDECGTELGPSLADGGAIVPDAGPRSSTDIEALCTPGAAPSALPTCIQNCFCRYRNNDEGLPPSDPSLLPLNLAESVYTCGKEANCGVACTPGPDEAGAP